MPDPLSEDFQAGVTVGLRQVARWLRDSNQRANELFDQHPTVDPSFWEGVEFGQQWIMQAHQELADQIAYRLHQHKQRSRHGQSPVTEAAEVPLAPREPKDSRLRRLSPKGRHRF